MDKLIINSNLRTIFSPDVIIGVFSDHNVNRLTFSCPRFYDGLDLSEFDVYINYVNALGEGSVYKCDDVSAPDFQHIEFSWLISSYVTKKEGKIKFSVCMRDYNDDNTIAHEFNTIPVIGIIKPGLETSPAVIENQIDILKQWEETLNKIPYIGENGHWYIYNVEEMRYEDSGISAKGEGGEGSSETAASVKQQLDNYKSENDTRVKAAEDAIDAIEADYLKAADKTELQDQITANANAITLLTDGADPDKVDSVKDLIDYVDKHGAEVTGIKEDIAANAQAIADEITRATGAEEALADRLDAVEADMDEHTHSWNDLTDKPFGDEGVEPIEFYTHSTIEGLDFVDLSEIYGGEPNSIGLVRISGDRDIDAATLKSGTITIMGGGVSESSAIADVIVQETEEFIFAANGAIMATLVDNCSIEMGRGVFILVPTKGIYTAINVANPDAMGYDLVSLTFPQAIKTLDDKYISGNIARTESVTAIDNRVEALEAIDHDAYVAADIALKTELEGKISDGDAATLEAAKKDASDKAVVVLSEAQKYADAAKEEAIAEASNQDAVVLAEAQKYAEDKVDALADGAVATNAGNIETLFEMFQWGEF